MRKTEKREKPPAPDLRADRQCWRCGGSGVHRNAPPGTTWPCDTCRGSGLLGPRGHYEDDGCDMAHGFVLAPCARCHKSEQSWRHECTRIENGKDCGEHHWFVAAEEGVVMAVREGCREHGISRDEVDGRWQRSEAAEADSSMCACCLGPSRVGFDYCRKCGDAPTQYSRPSCSDCGEPGYTFAGGRWVCEAGYRSIAELEAVG